MRRRNGYLWVGGILAAAMALVILVAFSAFFSASETAFSSLNQIRLKSRAEDGDTSAARVLAMSEKYGLEISGTITPMVCVACPASLRAALLGT